MKIIGSMLAVGEWGVRRVVKAIVLVQNNMICDKKTTPRQFDTDGVLLFAN